MYPRVVAPIARKARADDSANFLVPNVRRFEIECKAPGLHVGKILRDLVGDVDSVDVTVQRNPGSPGQRRANLGAKRHRNAALVLDRELAFGGSDVVDGPAADLTRKFPVDAGLVDEAGACPATGHCQAKEGAFDSAIPCCNAFA
jgi:hypothetical protein